MITTFQDIVDHKAEFVGGKINTYECYGNYEDTIVDIQINGDIFEVITENHPRSIGASIAHSGEPYNVKDKQLSFSIPYVGKAVLHKNH